MVHRLDRKTGGGKPYWELPQVVGRPFVLGIQTFHAHGSLAFSNAGVIRCLYAIQQSAARDEAGNLVIKTEPVEFHRYGDKQIPSGFFDFEGSEHVSAVLWTNAGTVSKFTRMAIAGPYPDDDLTVLRFGRRFDDHPNADKSKPFAFIVGDADAPAESWGSEANLFHNPNARHPVPIGLFETVTDSTFVDGVYADLFKSDFTPIMSVSNSMRGSGHRRHAEQLRDGILARGS